jgi:hypothetical protein
MPTKTPRGRVYTSLGGVYRKYEVQLVGKGYSDYVDTVAEAREIAKDGVTRLHVRAAYILVMERHSHHLPGRPPKYKDFEKWFLEWGKLTMRKRW